MTVRLRPLIKPDGRISRIRLSEPLHRKAFGLSLGFAVERVLEFPKLLQGCYLLRAISRSFTPLPRVRIISVSVRGALFDEIASLPESDGEVLLDQKGFGEGIPLPPAQNAHLAGGAVENNLDH